jgi:ABC-type nitrate/sulfonate/bicarbonate transport system ATPase subunit
MPKGSLLLHVEGVTKAFFANGEKLDVLQPITLDIADSEFIGLIGPSGCGKSTLLRIIAGIERPDSGRVSWPGTQQGSIPSLSFAFQHLALFPWRSVVRNIGFPLEVDDMQTAFDGKVRDMVKAFALEGFEHYFPWQISGGMKQRVALARALITKPQLLILDEPFGALDVHARIQLQDLLLTTCSGTGISVIMVSHDLHEAVRMSDRILVLSARPAHVVAEMVLPLWSKRDRLKLTASQTAPSVERLQELL